ncbi:DNA-binding response OmpR family regulator [Deinobacterium chartae]|uniref:DNA-binding response OmpR family regulator n=1 Tax=Deinobacterium chartae TaxID=521158 RepID=A0A841I7Q8_9DEIO|nr:response regulator transcription factor [Deinobacterium chartae]MBB6099882.1 DNA-binding response OmpR family regulator [Deinobacterium chartae]
MHLLIQTTNSQLEALLANTFEATGFTLQLVTSYEQLLAKLPCADALLLDVAQEAACTQRILHLRTVYPTVPLLVIHAPESSASRANILLSGADDCLGELLEPRELLARLRSVLRRSGYKTELRCGDTVIQPLLGEVWVRGSRVHLPERECALLMALAAKPDEVRSNVQLAERLGIPTSKRESHQAVHTSVSSLRRILQRINIDPNSIRNIRGQGYALQLTPLNSYA